MFIQVLLTLLFMGGIETNILASGCQPSLVHVANAIPQPKGKLYQLLGGPVTLHNYLRYETGISNKLSGSAQGVSRLFLQVIFPGVFDTLGGPTYPIFRKQWLNPSRKILGIQNYTPDPKERELLEKYGKWNLYLQSEDIINRHPYAAFTRNSLGELYRIILLGFYGMAAIQFSFENGFTDGIVDDDTYLKKEELQPQDDEVQLLISSVPFPHLAIRIKNKVYSYGYTHLQTVPIDMYLNPEEFQIPEKPQKADDPLYQVIKEVEQKSGLDKSTRTLQVITLKVGKKRREEIQKEFERANEKRYLNILGGNSCSSMGMRKLGLANPCFDPSPSTVALMMTFKKSLNANGVRRVFLVRNKGKGESNLTLSLRNKWISIQDANWHLINQLALFTPILRTHLNMKLGEKSLEYHEPGIANYFQGLEKTAFDAIMHDDSMIKYQALLHKWQNGQRSDSLKNAIDRFFNSFIQAPSISIQAQIDSPEIDIFELSRQQGKLKAYEKLQALTREAFSTPEPTSLSPR